MASTRAARRASSTLVADSDRWISPSPARVAPAAAVSSATRRETSSWLWRTAVRSSRSAVTSAATSATAVRVAQPHAAAATRQAMAVTPAMAGDGGTRAGVR